VQYQPKVGFEVPKLSHVAFASDGSCLIITAQDGGGLAVYSVDDLANNITKAAFQLATGGIAIRALAPNPNPELAHFIAVVMDNGHLMMADLQSKSFVGSSSLRSGVVCVSWSVKGKQLVAGLQDGTCVQLDVAGAVKATIPKAPDAPSNYVGKLQILSDLRLH
jgi:nucleoporin NUP159